MDDAFFQDSQANITFSYQALFVFLALCLCTWVNMFVCTLYVGLYVCQYYGCVCIDVFFQDGQAMRYIFLPGWTPSQLSSCLRGRLTWQLQQHSSAFLAGV